VTREISHIRNDLTVGLVSTASIVVSYHFAQFALLHATLLCHEEAAVEMQSYSRDVYTLGVSQTKFTTDLENREKSGENVKKVWNFEIYSQFSETAPILNNCYNFSNIIWDVYSQIHSKLVHFK